MILTFKKILELLTAAERRRMGFVVVVMILTSLAQVIGVVSIMPFLGVLADPGMIETNMFINRLYRKFSFESTESFLLFLGIMVFVVTVMAAIVRAIGLYIQTHFSQMRRHSLSLRALTHYMSQPYEFFLNRHSGEMVKNVLSEVDEFVNSGLTPLMQLVAQGLTLVAMVALLLAVDPRAALYSGIALGTSYFLIFKAFRGYTERLGKTRSAANTARFKAANEALGGIKDVKLLGRESFGIQQFDKPSRQMSQSMADGVVVSQLPKFFVEAIAFGGIVILAISLMVRFGGGSEALGKVLPLIGLFALAGYRILPALQAIYSSFSKLKFGSAAVDVLHADLKGSDTVVPEPANTKLTLSQRIEIDQVCYRYPGQSQGGLKAVSFAIEVGSTVGIVGGTGAGKTTLVDLLLGLLTPQSGQILLDGIPLSAKNTRNWQANIGYVPQNIFLLDASIAHNIAFCLPANRIDMDRVRVVAQQAQLDEFIEGELPEGYTTEVGERGVRLSGGQRQRIGIARALYHDPSVIVFDEATSALDTTTERDLMAAIGLLRRSKTVIMIAHRLSTIRQSDKVIYLEKGQVMSEGTFEELLQENATFRKLANEVESEQA